MKTIKLADWIESGKEKFNTADIKQIKFQCPSCKESQTAQDFIDAKIEDSNTKFYYSCIGRWVENRGCKWTLGGLLQIHSTEVISEYEKKIPVFEFAE